MTRGHTLLVRALLGALLLLTIGAGTASADPGLVGRGDNAPTQPAALPEDPGLD